MLKRFEWSYTTRKALYKCRSIKAVLYGNPKFLLIIFLSFAAGYITVLFFLIDRQRLCDNKKQNETDGLWEKWRSEIKIDFGICC